MSGPRRYICCVGNKIIKLARSDGRGGFNGLLVAPLVLSHRKYNMPYLQRLIVIHITVDNVDIGLFPSSNLHFGFGNVADKADSNVARVARNLSKKLKLCTPVSN